MASDTSLSVEAQYSYDDEISLAGRICNSTKVAICANTPFLKQLSNLKKIKTSAVQAFANFLVAECLNLPEER